MSAALLFVILCELDDIHIVRVWRKFVFVILCELWLFFTINGKRKVYICFFYHLSPKKVCFEAFLRNAQSAAFGSFDTWAFEICKSSYLDIFCSVSLSWWISFRTDQVFLTHASQMHLVLCLHCDRFLIMRVEFFRLMHLMRI